MASLSIAVALATGSLLTSAVGSARAAVNNPGRILPPSAFCTEDDRILADVPVMVPAQVQYGSGGFAPGSTVPPQVVAFRANLAWWNGSNWVEYLHSPWYYQVAGNMTIGFVGYTGSWFDWNTGAVLTSAIVYHDLPNPRDFDNEYYYRVYYDYYWQNDQYRDSGSFPSWAGQHEENRSNPYGTGVISQETADFCKFPGPNWLLDIN
jgi:hypothetical protein